MANILQKLVYNVLGAGGKPLCPSQGARKQYALSSDERRLRHEKHLACCMEPNTEREERL